MTLTVSNPLIRLVVPARTSLSDLMNQIRTWLDARKIETSLFRIERTDQGVVVFEIGFPSPDVAATFRHDFDGARPV